MYVFNYLDLIPYILMVVLLTIIANGNGNAKVKAQKCFGLMFLFAAIRYGIGYDYYSYVKSVLHQTADYSMERFEPLSRVLIEVGYYTHYQVFFVLSSFLTLFPLYKACLKLSINPAFSLIVYFLFPNYYLESLSIVRNAIAYSFVLYGFVLLYNKRLIWSLLVMIIAVLFHKSAAIGLLIFPLYFIRAGIWFHLFLYVSSFVISNVAVRFIGDYASFVPLFSAVEGYVEHARGEGGTMSYIINGLCVFNFLVWNRLKKLSADNTFYLAFCSFGGCLWNIFLPIDSTIALRLSSFFQIFIIFIVPQYKYIFGDMRRRFATICSYAFFVLLFLSYFYINVSSYMKSPNERMSNLPYQTIFYNVDYTNYVY